MAIEKLLTQYVWLKFSHQERILMREVFGIPKSSGIRTTNGIIESDGSNENDLKVVNVQSMQAFLETDESDFDSLLNMTVEKIDEMLEDEAKQKEEIARQDGTNQRINEINEVVETIIETITNLPLDAQIKIKVALANIIKHDNSKTTDIEEGKEGEDQQGAEGSGGGSDSSARNRKGRPFSFLGKKD
jgi:uncharacterized membrane protein